MRYVLYARKSSESEDRQVQSIDDQTRIMRDMATSRGLTIVEEVTESHSAKDPGKRPGFEQVVTLIEQGHADAILCWHVNRLTRNPIDAGRLSWLLQTEKLRAIQTSDRAFLPSDNVLLFSIETGVATQDILTMKKNVRRGTESKLSKGWAPYRAPEGYRNNLYDHTIEPDPERFESIQRAWQLLISGTHTVSQVWRTLNEKWGYKTRPTHRGGDKPLARTVAYKMFSNPFYAGYFPYDGELFVGSHVPMITLAEFEMAQMHIRGQVGKAHRHKHLFAYAGLMTCGTCGKTVTAEVQGGRHRRGRYVYYHCANRGSACVRKNVREEVIEAKIAETLEALTITPEFRHVVMVALEEWSSTQADGGGTEYVQQQQSLVQMERMLSELLEMRLRQTIDDALFIVKQKELKEEVSRLRLALAGTRERINLAKESVRNAMIYRETSSAQFQTGSPERRREIATALGTCFALAGDELRLELNPLLAFMQDKKEQLKVAKELSDRPQGLLRHSVSESVSSHSWAKTGSFTGVSEPRKIGSQRVKETSARAKVSSGWTDRTETEHTFGPLDDLFRLACAQENYFPRPSWVHSHD